MSAAAHEYVEPVNANLLCAICACPFETPVQSPCGHTFCGECISAALRADARCPTCRMAIADADLAPASLIVVNLVNELRIRCPHASQGCGETPERSLLAAHLANACPHDPIPCRHPSCSRRLPRSQIPDHELVCTFRPVPCPRCGLTVHAGDQDHHAQSACDASLVSCDDCGAQVTRGDLMAHMQSCNQHAVPCECERFGCAATVKREAMPAHAAECAFVRIKPFLLAQEREHNVLREQSSALRLRVEQLEVDLAAIGRRHDMATETSMLLCQENEQLRLTMDALHEQLRSFASAQNAYRVADTLQLRDEVEGLRGVVRAMQMQMGRMAAEVQGRGGGGKVFRREAEGGDVAGKL